MEMQKSIASGMACNASVGVTGFEPATTWSQTRCATGLRYAPIATAKLVIFFDLQTFLLKKSVINLLFYCYYAVFCGIFANFAHYL